MANTNNNIIARSIYDNLCNSLDKREWKYKKFTEDNVISFNVGGDDLPMSFIFRVDADRPLLRVTSPLPFKAGEDKMLDLAVACCVASYGLADGSFDFDMKEGMVTFRLTTVFRDSRIGDELFDYLIDCSCTIVDEYNEKFFALNMGLMSLEEFINADR